MIAVEALFQHAKPSSRLPTAENWPESAQYQKDILAIT
jgi:hypothetical protein